MQLIFDDLGYKLVPYASGLCYEIWRYLPERIAKRGRTSGKVAPAGWKSIDCYPVDPHAGALKVYSLCVNADPSVHQHWESAVKRMEEIRDSILRATWREVGDDAPPRSLCNCGNQCACRSTATNPPVGGCVSERDS
ncbi:MAG TPA: hypothetical protein VFG89_01800 [Coriobacteriia bacterium]|nr:hypothetical protein [Coriobacteriia bacterium]